MVDGAQLGEEVGIPALTIKQSMAPDETGADDGSCKTGTMVWSAGAAAIGAVGRQRHLTWPPRGRRRSALQHARSAVAPPLTARVCGPRRVPQLAGRRLAAHLVRNRADLIRGARILELGSGTGIVGITCAALGGHVILTDIESVLQTTQDNVEANLAVIEEGGGSAQVCLGQERGGGALGHACGSRGCAWCSLHKPAWCTCVGAGVQVAPLDWTQPEEAVFSIPYDWVIGERQRGSSSMTSWAPDLTGYLGRGAHLLH